jgi:2-methylisocitrate lyase-like PEP mutase family enzyme
LHVVRTVRAYERAGAAAIQLEDQAFPKRCGHLDDKQLIGADEFVGKLHVALDTRREDTVIIARTDARGPADLDEAIARAQRYAAEGADMLFVEAPQSVAEIERIAKEVDAPLLLNAVPGGKSPAISDEDLARLGFRLAIYPGAVLVPVANAAVHALSRMSGRQAGDLVGPAGIFGAVGLDQRSGLDKRYRSRPQHER